MNRKGAADTNSIHLASSEQENDSVIMEENSSDEVEERQMTSQDGTNPSSQDSQSQPSMSPEKETGVFTNFDLPLINSSY
jgi:hypothetical protein